MEATTLQSVERFTRLDIPNANGVIERSRRNQPSGTSTKNNGLVDHHLFLKLNGQFFSTQFPMADVEFTAAQRQRNGGHRLANPFVAHIDIGLKVMTRVLDACAKASHTTAGSKVRFKSSRVRLTLRSRGTEHQQHRDLIGQVTCRVWA